MQQKQHKRGRLLDGSSDNACHRRSAERINHVWSFDFCHDLTADGKALKVFSVIDEFTRRCLLIEVQRRITGTDVVRLLDALMALYGVPEHLRCDNGPEFVSSAVKAWLTKAKVTALYIAPASPWENAYAESYHARLRDEMLEREEFATLPQEAQALLEIWREEYNQERPHSRAGVQDIRGVSPPQVVLEPCSAMPRRAQHDEQRVMGTVAQ